MHSIPLNLKQLLFNKGADESLTPEEQKRWEEFVASKQPENAWIEPDDPLFRVALELYFQLKDEDFGLWERFEQSVLLPEPATKIKKRGKRLRMFKYLSIAVAILIVIGGGWLFFKKAPREPEYLSLNTPNGQVDTLNFDDGTIVYVNGGSTLYYPAVFTKYERQVELIGEAYFRVKDNPALPFHVIAGKTDVIAVGTEFNVKAYAGDDSVLATLIEGVVRVKYGNQTKIIGPSSGEQAIVMGGIIRSDSVNVDNTVAWKNGFITLEKQTIESILQQIKHAYGVDFEIKRNQHIDLKNRISKKESVAKVIEIVNNATGEEMLRLEGDKVKKIIVR